MHTTWTVEQVGKARRLRRNKVRVPDAVLSLNKPRREVEEAFYATLREEDDVLAHAFLMRVLAWQTQGVPLCNGRPINEVTARVVHTAALR